jgi:hypothetical protein
MKVCILYVRPLLLIHIEHYSYQVLYCRFTFVGKDKGGYNKLIFYVTNMFTL